MSKKRVDPRFAVKDDKPKFPKCPIHANTTQFVTRTLPDGTQAQEPADPVWSIKVSGFVDTDKVRGYEVVGRMWERGLDGWKKGKKWVALAYITPFTYQLQLLSKSPFLMSSIGVLVKDIQDYEAAVKAIIQKGI